MGGKTPDAAQNRALAEALAAYQKARLAAGPSGGVGGGPGGVRAVLAKNPSSPWRVALRTNLGVEYYRRGEFSKALDAWQKAWADGKDETSRKPPCWWIARSANSPAWKRGWGGSMN